MKKFNFLFIIICLVFNSYSQEQIITICSEKSGCEFAIVNLSKAQIDNVLNKPNFLSKEKEVVILNINECQFTIEKNSTPQTIHQKYCGKGTIKESKNFDLNKYLLAKACFGNCSLPIIANAGKQANIKIGLTGNFTFDKKFSFSVTSPEGNFSSYFLFNLQNGYSMMNNDAMKKMVNEPFEGEINQIMTSTSDFYQYMKSSEGNISMKMGGKQNNLLDNTKKVSADFFKSFKKTGAKNQLFGTEESEEYAGISEGKQMSIWLSCSNGIAIDKKITYSLTGYFGLGYVVSPAGETFLITAIEGSGMKIKLLGIENSNLTFFGNVYKPMGDMMATTLGQSQNEINTNLNNQNEYATQMNLETLRANRQFSQSSDL